MPSGERDNVDMQIEGKADMCGNK